MFELQNSSNGLNLEFKLACSRLTFLTIFGTMNTPNDQLSQPLTNALIKITAISSDDAQDNTNNNNNNPPEDEDRKTLNKK